MIFGELCGVLSWVFVWGLEGCVDFDGDGGIMMDELVLFLNEMVCVVMEGR